MPRAVCPRCKSEFVLKPTRFRTQVKCPKCRKIFRPGSDAETSATEPPTETETNTASDPTTETVRKAETATIEKPSVKKKPSSSRRADKETPDEKRKRPRLRTKGSARERGSARSKRKSKRSRKYSGRTGTLRGSLRALGEALPVEARVGFRRRLLALVIDALICGVIGAALGIITVMLYADLLSEMLYYDSETLRIQRSLLEEPVRRTPLETPAAEEETGDGEDALYDEEAWAAASTVDNTPRNLFDGVLGKLLGALVGIVVVLPFFGLIEGVSGASPGKKILEIRVRNFDGRWLQGNRLLGRYLMKYGAGVFGFFSILSFLYVSRGLGELLAILGGIEGVAFVAGCFAAISEHRQGLHDQLINTAVFPLRAPEEPEGQVSPHSRSKHT